MLEKFRVTLLLTLPYVSSVSTGSLKIEYYIHR